MKKKKNVSSKSEDILFNIPFKDGPDIKYNTQSSALGENTEICCLIPNVQTSTIKVIYYIKITAEPDDLLAKKIELKMMVDFYSKDQDQLNSTVYDSFNNQVRKINSGEADINYLEPYLNNQNNYNFNPRMSHSVYSHSNSLNLQSNNNNNYNDLNRINSLNQNNYNQNQFNNNNYDNAAPPLIPGYQNNNNNIYQNNYPNNSNYQNMNNNLNINNISNEQNSMNLPEPHNQNLEEEQADLPTLEEIEKQNEFNKPQEQEYPSF